MAAMIRASGPPRWPAYVELSRGGYRDGKYGDAAFAFSTPLVVEPVKSFVAPVRPFVPITIRSDWSRRAAFEISSAGCPLASGRTLRRFHERRRTVAATNWRSSASVRFASEHRATRSRPPR